MNISNYEILTEVIVIFSTDWRISKAELVVYNLIRN